MFHWFTSAIVMVMAARMKLPKFSGQQNEQRVQKLWTAVVETFWSRDFRKSMAITVEIRRLKSDMVKQIGSKV